MFAAQTFFFLYDTSMLSMSDIKMGTAMKLDDGQPYVVVWTQHSKQARSGAVLRTKLKNLLDGRVLEKTFQGSDKAEAADLRRGKASFLYSDADAGHFMNTESYEQFGIATDQIEQQLQYLKDGDIVDVLYFEDNPVTISLPPKVELKVTQTVEGAKGDTAQGRVTKPATVETGMEVAVPLFVKQDDIIRVNTDTGEYVERV